MPSMAVEPEDESVGVPGPRVRRTRASHVEVQDASTAEAPAAERRAMRRLFRLYCFSCGRSTESAAAPQRSGRCPTCGGTMLLELSAD